ncbi:MAG TPA: PVC-type heme-binding CxxCH protein [Tepidisphaeraceae bacterium]|jgi:putative heme-binding domain-containing protein
MRYCFVTLLAFLAFGRLCPPATGAANSKSDPFAENVRTADPQSPEQERARFHLPPGFEIQLVASEPDVHKPMNLAFDARGRLWVSSSLEYPFAATGDKARDAIKILEDFDETGRARKVTTFAEGLNIPIGLYPYGDGVIAYAIAKISYYRDTDGDGKCDQVEPLIGDFGFDKDTHGMASNFRRGFDGWIYGCHGFNNVSTVGPLAQVSSPTTNPISPRPTTARSVPQQITMKSGNTYRFRPDGSSIQHFTTGQTNPFGFAFDNEGNAYTSDSHSKPIYQLIRGGYYEGIWCEHDGLGFAPPMMQHLHGSTAISSVCIYESDQFPEEFQHNGYVGNVITSRINRDRITHNGSSPVAHEQKDLVSTDDPWFRPNFIQLGPDGAMYIADFYNRIIGHYEVPLDHPGRDRERGRIWRLIYKGADHSRPGDLTKATADELIAKLASPNLALRSLATDQLSDRIGTSAIEPLKNLLASTSPRPAVQRVHAMWVLFRLSALDLPTVSSAAHDDDALVRTHAMRMLAETGNWTDAHRALVIAALRDADPLVTRCAADALGQHPAAQNVRPLLDLLHRAPPADTHLAYTTRVAIKSQLSATGGYASIEQEKLDARDVDDLAYISLAVSTRESGRFVAKHLELFAKDRTLLTQCAKHVAHLAQGEGLDPLVNLLRDKFKDDLDLQLDLCDSIRQGILERGTEPSLVTRAWAEEIARAILSSREDKSGWTATALDGSPVISSGWRYEPRRCTDGIGPVPFLSSLPMGEQQTGILRSSSFAVPSKLSFFLAGHNGYPNTTPPTKNLVRLRDVDTEKILAEAPVPRNDTAHLIAWDLHDYVARKAQLEIVDADTGNAYAWIAFARLEPAVVKMPPVQQRLVKAAQIAAALKLDALKDQLHSAFTAGGNDLETRLAIGSALLSLGSEAALPQIAQTLQDASVPVDFRETVAAALGSSRSHAAQNTLIDAFKTAPQRLQSALAKSLSASAGGAERLMSAIKDGQAPAGVLLEPGVRDQLAAANVANLDQRIGELTRGLPAPKMKLTKLIAQRIKSIDPAKASVQAGEQLFTKNCVVCHQIGGRGAIVGPQLDGVGKRGPDRLVEDILDPNRNVDPSFHYSIVTLKNGNVVTGLQRKDDGNTLTFFDGNGTEITVAKDQIKKRVETNTSLMPWNFGEVLSEADLNNLIAYLRSK